MDLEMGSLWSEAFENSALSQLVRNIALPKGENDVNIKLDDALPDKCQMDAKGSVDAATVDADEDSVPEKNNFTPRRTKYMDPCYKYYYCS